MTISPCDCVDLLRLLFSPFEIGKDMVSKASMPNADEHWRLRSRLSDLETAHEVSYSP